MSSLGNEERKIQTNIATTSSINNVLPMYTSLKYPFAKNGSIPSLRDKGRDKKDTVYF